MNITIKNCFCDTKNLLFILETYLKNLNDFDSGYYEITDERIKSFYGLDGCRKWKNGNLELYFIKPKEEKK